MTDKCIVNSGPVSRLREGKKKLKLELPLGAVASAMRDFTRAGPLSALLAIDRSHRDQCGAHSQYIVGIFSDKESLMNTRNNYMCNMRHDIAMLSAQMAHFEKLTYLYAVFAEICSNT